MVCLIALTQIPCLLLEAKLDSFLTRVEMSNLKSLFFLTFFITYTCNFYFFTINFKLYGFFFTFLIKLTWILIFLFFLANNINLYEWLWLWLFFFFLLFFMLLLGFFLLFFTWWILRIISLSQLFKNFLFDCISSLNVCRILFRNLFYSSLFIFFVKFSHSICNFFSINFNFPKFVIRMMKIYAFR